MKRKEIKFKAVSPSGRTLEGRQDGVIYRIHKDKEKADACAPAWSVSTYDTKDEGRNINTAGHTYFHMDGAKEFCQQIAAREINLESLRVKFEAEDRAKEDAAIKAATERAKAFRDKLDQHGIKFSTLLDLAAEADALGGMERNILLGLERGEVPPCE